MADTAIVFDWKDFNEQKITCSNCGWTGTGSEAIIIDMYGIGDVKLVSCPGCDTTLGTLPRSDKLSGGPQNDMPAN